MKSEDPTKFSVSSGLLDMPVAPNGGSLDKPGPSLSSNWEQRQTHTAFYQAQISSTQQAAIFAMGASPLLFVLGDTMTKLSGLRGDQDWAVLFVTIFAWFILNTIFAVSFSHSAARIRAAYHKEHAELFPGSDPYLLESFLLDFSDKNPKLVRV